MSKTTRKKIERVAPLTIEEAKTKNKDNRLKKCRYCTNEKDSKRFYNSFDFLDTDGKMSICIDCCSYLFNYYYSVHSRIDIALYELCKVTNVRYCSKTYSALMTSLEKNNLQSQIDAINGEEQTDISGSFDEIAVNTKTSIFGKYLSILRRIYSNKDENLYFDLYSNDRPEGYEDKSTDKAVSEIITDVYKTKMTALEKKWGRQTEEDYAFLEDEYNGWAKTKDVDEKSVDLLIREICLQQLYIRKKRDNGESISKGDLDALTNLMDKCSITPDKLKENSSSKMMASWGTWIKDVETMSPAEWIENQELFKDVEGIEQYVDKHFGRSLRNYIGMQRDFRVVAAKLDEEAENSDFSDIITETEDGDSDGEN